MELTSVTSKGQVTIPQDVRKKLGIRQGSRISFDVVDDHVEMRVQSTPSTVAGSGYGLLKSKKASVPADFDAAELVRR
jgi:AbrB family looped-hinge helix DNA binding protein